MKQKTKKVLCLLLSVVMVLGMTACGAGNVVASDVSEDTIRADAQEYLSSFVGDDATITALNYNQNSVSDTELLVTSNVSYTAGGADNTATFSMTYVLENGAWVLNGMDAQMGGEASTELQAPEVEPAKPMEEIDIEVSSNTQTPTTNVSAPSVEGVQAVRGIELKQTGTFTDGGNFDDWDYVMTVDDDRYSIIFKDGTTSEPCYDSENMGDGYITLRTSNENVNSTGLVTMDGEILIPCEAALIEWIDTRSTEYRFLSVIYGTEVTTNKEEAAFYVHEGMFSIYPEEGDVLYKGYGKIYDVVNKQFVGDLKLSLDGYVGVDACGDCIVLEDAEGIAYLYDCDGNLIKQTAKLNGVGNGYIVCYDSGSYEVYDTTGTLRLSSKDSLGTVTSTHGFLKKNTNSNYVLIDLDGNQVLPDVYKSIGGENNGIVEVQNVMGEHQLIRLDGEILATTTAGYFTETGWNSGYYYFRENEKYTLIGPEGIIAEELDSYPSELVLEKDGALLVLNEKAFNLTMDDYREAYYDGLITVQSDETGKYGLYELYNGKQLLDFQYNEIKVMYESMVYARQGETWTIFEIIPQYR